MNVNQLHRALSKLIASGHGRKPVAINTDTFSFDDSCNVRAVEDTKLMFVCNTDDDGDVKYNKNGSESGKFTLILCGEILK